MSVRSIEIIDSGKQRSLSLPEPANAAANALWDCMPRMDGWFPPHREAEKIQFFMAVTAAANSMPKNVTKHSLTKAAFNACALGLLPDTVHGYCHFVPLRKNKGKADERVECELWIGYRGFLELAYACGFLSSLTTEVVLSGEECKRWNDSGGAKIHHDIPLDRPDESSIKIGDIQAAYMIYATCDGTTDVELVSGRTLRSLAKRGNVWYSDPVAMSRKTPIRRGAKRWRISGQHGKYLAGAIALDEQAESGLVQSQLMPGDPNALPVNDETGDELDLEALGLTSEADDLPDIKTDLSKAQTLKDIESIRKKWLAVAKHINEADLVNLSADARIKELESSP